MATDLDTTVPTAGLIKPIRLIMSRCGFDTHSYRVLHSLSTCPSFLPLSLLSLSPPLSFQLFMNEDGGCGSMIEHSVADGPAAYSVTVFSLDVLNR